MCKDVKENMKILHLDDQIEWKNKIKELILKVQFELDEDFTVISCSTINELYQHEDVQLYILDIDIQGESVISEYESILKNNPDSIIVYLTHHLSYMPQAFGINVFRYIEKTKYEELIDVIKFANCFFDSKGLDIKTPDGKLYFKYSNIYYICSYNKKLYLYTRNDEIRIYENSINQFAQELPYYFVLINKQLIINLDKVSLFSKERVCLDSIEDEFKISRRKFKDVSEKYLKRSKEKIHDFFR